MKEIAIISNIISSIYFMSGMLAQHEKAKEIVARLEKGFKILLLEFRKKQPSETIQILLKFFGYLSGAAFAGTLLIVILRVQSKQILLAFSVLFSVSSILGWSLFWVVRHTEIIKQFTQWLLICGGGPILFILFDVFTDTEITNVFYSLLNTSFGPLLNLPVENELIFESLVVFGFCTGFVVVLYCVTWLFAAPTALVAWCLVAILIISARVIEKTFPKKPIVVVFFTLWLISFLYLTNAN